MLQTAVFPGRYVQGAGVLSQLGDEVAPLGKNALIVAGRTAEKAIVATYAPAWSEKFRVNVEPFGGECCDAQIERLARSALEKHCDCVIGMGGGKAIDTAKAVAHATGTRLAIVPTIASTDAPTSAVSVIYTSDGAFQRYLFLPRNPDLVVVDTQVIAAAPVRFLVAGMGDALATWFEAESCRLSGSPNQCGGRGTLAAYAIARLCYDTILEYGEAAKAACLENVVTPALSHVVEANTLHSGLGFESGGLAAAHSIHNGLTRLEDTHNYYHGEKVAIGVLSSLFLTDRSKALIEQAYQFCESVGLPTTLAEIGLAASTDDRLYRVAEGACLPGETIHHEAFDVSPEAVYSALKTADRLGRDRKARSA